MSTNLFITLSIVILLLLLILVIWSRKRKTTVRIAADSENNQLYIGNLSYRVNEHRLKKFFSEYGEVNHVRIVKNRQTGRSKGFAFITFTNKVAAEKALSAHGEEVDGRSIVVRVAKPRD